MPFPLIPVLAAAAGGAALFFGYEKIVKPKLAHPGAEGPLPGTVSELKKGQAYAIQVALAGSQPGAGGVKQFSNVGGAATFLKNFFQAAGFDLGVSIPTLRDKESADKFEAGLTSAWIFTATWTRPEKFVGGEGHPLIGMALFTPLPSKS